MILGFFPKLKNYFIKLRGDIQIYNTISNTKKILVKIVIVEAVPPQFLRPFDSWCK